jgi:hypothetical protein
MNLRVIKSIEISNYVRTGKAILMALLFGAVHCCNKCKRCSNLSSTFDNWCKKSKAFFKLKIDGCSETCFKNAC